MGFPRRHSGIVENVLWRVWRHGTQYRTGILDVNETNRLSCYPSHRIESNIGVIFSRFTLDSSGPFVGLIELHGIA